MKTACHVEQHEADGQHREWAVSIDAASAPELLKSLHGAWSATLRIPGDTQELVVSFSEGAAAVLLVAGEDDFYDLLAEAPGEGWVDFVHGGQAAQHPARHRVSVREADDCAVAFLDARAVAPATRWERQGRGEPQR